MLPGFGFHRFSWTCLVLLFTFFPPLFYYCCCCFCGDKSSSPCLLEGEGFCNRQWKQHKVPSLLRNAWCWKLYLLPFSLNHDKLELTCTEACWVSQLAHSNHAEHSKWTPPLLSLQNLRSTIYSSLCSPCIYLHSVNLVWTTTGVLSPYYEENLFLRRAFHSGL